MRLKKQITLLDSSIQNSNKTRRFKRMLSEEGRGNLLVNCTLMVIFVNKIMNLGQLK